MKSFLALLAFLQLAGVSVERVKVPAGDGVMLDAALVMPQGAPTAPPVVALHGCGGPFAVRDGTWAVALAKAGHPVLLPDSFGSRGLGSQCDIPTRERTVRSSRQRRADAIAAATYLRERLGAATGGVNLIGWSNGGGTVLAVAREAPDLPAGLFQRFVAFYPGCRSTLKAEGWKPSAPLLMLVGAADDWTPAPPCADLAARFPAAIRLVTYPDAYHDFDVPDRPVKERAAATASGGRAHVGTNEPARQDALKQVLPFLAAR